MKQVIVPDIGDFKNVPVIEVLVAVGDSVVKDQPIVVLESDKSTIEIPSPEAGVVASIDVKLGDRVSMGSALLVVQSSNTVPQPVATVSANPGSAHAHIVEARREGKAVPAATELMTIVVPDIGDFKDVPVIEVLIAPGDTIAKNQPLIVVESDKSTMEIPSPAAGRVLDILVKSGDRVSANVPLLKLESEGAAAVQSPVANAAAAPPAASTSVARNTMSPAVTALATAPAENVDNSIYAGPAVRKLAREFGVDLYKVQGSGLRGRISADDVQQHVKSAMATGAKPAEADSRTTSAPFALLPWPSVDHAKFGSVEPRPLSRIRKISGANLHRNWVMIPHVTNHDDADVTEMEAFRVELNKQQNKHGIRVSPLAFIMKACVAALKAFPEFNASLDGETLILKRYYHIGFAADTPNGLVVPVIRDADSKGVVQIAGEMSELAAKARAGKLSSADMQGGSFSISSLGGIGGSYFTPIINAPEVAILGVGKTQSRVVWIDGGPQPRQVLPLSLSWDHRVVDGAAAGRFNAYLARALGDLRRLLL